MVSQFINYFSVISDYRGFRYMEIQLWRFRFMKIRAIGAFDWQPNILTEINLNYSSMQFLWRNKRLTLPEVAGSLSHLYFFLKNAVLIKLMLIHIVRI